MIVYKMGVAVPGLVKLPFGQAGPLRAAPPLRAPAARGPVHEVRTATGDPARLITGYQAVRRGLTRLPVTW